MAPTRADQNKLEINERERRFFKAARENPSGIYHTR